MENNLLPSKKTKGLLNKVKMFFKSIFNKNLEYPKARYEEDINQTNDVIEMSSFVDELKNEVDSEKANKEETLEYIVNIIEESSENLKKLSIEQLEEVNEYYTNKIHKIDQEINKLKK